MGIDVHRQSSQWTHSAGTHCLREAKLDAAGKKARSRAGGIKCIQCSSVNVCATKSCSHNCLLVSTDRKSGKPLHMPIRVQACIAPVLWCETAHALHQEQAAYHTCTGCGLDPLSKGYNARANKGSPKESAAKLSTHLIASSGRMDSRSISLAMNLQRLRKSLKPSTDHKV